MENITTTNSLGHTLQVSAYTEALSALMRSNVFHAADDITVFRYIAETIAKVLQVNRVSMWEFVSTTTALHCQGLFEDGIFSTPGTVIPENINPAYFLFLKESRVLAVSNVSLHPATVGFVDSYYEPLNIISVIELPILAGGDVIGSVCVEHKHIQRDWTSEEILFVVAITDFLGSHLQHKERRKAEENLRKANADLERIVLERTATLEKTIAELKVLNNELELRRNELELSYLNLDEQQQQLEQQSAEIEAINHELKERNTRLEELINLKSEFLSIAAHDLKNPLASIMLRTESLKRATTSPDKFPEQKLRELVLTSSDWIYKLSGRMFEIISSILESEAVENGDIVISMNDISLNNVLSEVIEANLEKAQAKNITLNCQAFPETFVLADSQKLYEIFDNLLSNAIKFSPLGASVRIVTERKDAEYRIAIQDQGPGIAPEDMDKLFRKYQRLAARPTAGETSTGLGLSIVKKLVELHNGRVWAESKQGEGTVFWVALPSENKD